MGLLDKLFGIKKPPPLPEFSAEKSARSYVDAMADPGLQSNLIDTEKTYRPEYQDINLMLADRAVDPTADILSQVAGRGYETARDLSRRQTAGDIETLQDMGGRYTEAVRGADPFMAARVQQANQLAEQAYLDAQMTDLSPEMRRRADQSSLEALIGRGRGMDNVALASQAMGREDYLRQIRNQNRQQAQSLGGYAANLNQASAPDVFSTLLQRDPAALQAARQQQGLAYGSAAQSTPYFINPDAGVNLGMADASRRAEYMANTYGSQMAAKSGIASGVMGMVGNIASGGMSGALGALGSMGSASGGGNSPGSMGYGTVRSMPRGGWGQSG
jgi:hypothetical protein